MTLPTRLAVQLDNIARRMCISRNPVYTFWDKEEFAQASPNDIIRVLQGRMLAHSLGKWFVMRADKALFMQQTENSDCLYLILVRYNKWFVRSGNGGLETLTSVPRKARLFTLCGDEGLRFDEGQVARRKLLRRGKKA